MELIVHMVAECKLNPRPDVGWHRCEVFVRIQAFHNVFLGYLDNFRQLRCRHGVAFVSQMLFDLLFVAVRLRCIQILLANNLDFRVLSKLAIQLTQ